MRGSLLLQLPFLCSALAQTSGKFNTITFNVAGLPPILNGNEIPGDKDTNTARIGQLLTQYNISLVHMQEDFVRFMSFRYRVLLLTRCRTSMLRSTQTTSILTVHRRVVACRLDLA